MKETLKSPVVDYFVSGRYNEHLIPKAHFDIIHEIDDVLKIRIEPQLDRNYSHATGFLLILNPKGWINGAYDFLADEELEVLKNTPGQMHWSVYFQLSLAAKTAAYTVNVRKIVKDEIDVREVQETEIPAELKPLLTSVLEIFEDYAYTVLPFNAFSEKTDWIGAVFSFGNGYQPKLSDLLFESFEFYKEAGI